MIAAEKVCIICERCQITIPGSLVGLSFRACCRGELQENVPFEMMDNSLRVKLVIVSLLEHNLNQRISHFRPFNSARKVNTDESFGSSPFKPHIALPTVR